MRAGKGTGVGPVVVLDATGEPAFAADGRHRIIAWNKALENLLGYPAPKVIGKTCWKVLDGHDVFGNPYCCQFCGVRQALLRNEPVRNFEVDLRKASGGVARVVCRTLLIRNERPAQSIIVHLLQSTIAREVANDHAGVAPAASCGKHPGMTKRQLEVLGYFAEGWTNVAVAEALGISAATVRTHTNNIRRKLGVHNLRQAIATARHRDLI